MGLLDVIGMDVIYIQAAHICGFLVTLGAPMVAVFQLCSGSGVGCKQQISALAVRALGVKIGAVHTHKGMVHYAFFIQRDCVAACKLIKRHGHTPVADSHIF